MFRSTALWIGATLIGAGLILWSFFNSSSLLSSNSTVTEEKSVDAEEDFFAYKINAIKYNEQGNIYYTLKSTHITHNEKTDVGLVTEPLMEFFPTAGIRWFASAEQGKIYNHQKDVELQKNVIIKKFENQSKNPVLTLNTQALNLRPEGGLLSTTQAVRIVTDKAVTQATGMKADMERDRMQLLSNVRTQYEGR